MAIRKALLTKSTFIRLDKDQPTTRRKGNCWDNAVVERFFRSLKCERTNDLRYGTREKAKIDVVDYIEMFYNSRRYHSYLGYRSPADYEKLAEVA